MLLTLVRDVRLPRLLRLADVWLLASVPVWLFIFDDYSPPHGRPSPASLSWALPALPLTPDRSPGAGLEAARADRGRLLQPLPVAPADRGSAAPHALLLAVPLSLLVAFASYRLVEAPFLRLRRRWSSSS